MSNRFVSFLQGILEVGSAIGYMMGPPIGGVLYQVNL